MILRSYRLLIFLYFCKRIRGAIEGFIVGGSFADIESHPYSAHLIIHCVNGGNASNYVCGSSIVNQRMTLTAAHCLEDCNMNSKIRVTVGDNDIRKGMKAMAKKFIIHEEYDTITSKNDIALVLLKTPFVLNKKVSRVALFRSPAYEERGEIAGWGVTALKGKTSKVLKHIYQRIIPYEACIGIVNTLPLGCFCGYNKETSGFVSTGDSGGALVVDGYIQIGIVSYKLPDVSQALIVYTDISFFYDWITERAGDVYCDADE